MKGEKIRGKWVACHSGGCECCSRYSFSFGEHYREVNPPTHSVSSEVKFLLPSNLPFFFVWTLNSWDPEGFPHLINRRGNLSPFFQCCYCQNGGIPYLLHLLVACSAKAPRDTHCYLCGLSVFLLNLCILNYWSFCGKHSTALSKGLGNLSVTKTYICP